MSDELKQQLDAELSTLIREYQRRGLDPSAISDSLDWHAELAQSRSSDCSDRTTMMADD